MLFILQGPSGSGKTTQAKKLAAARSFTKITTATTRPPRKGEIDGIDYFFIDEIRYDEMLKKGELLAPTTVYGNRYGIPQKSLLPMIESKDAHAIIVLDDKGAKELAKKGAVLICLTLREEERHRRLSLRGDADRFDEKIPHIQCHHTIDCTGGIDEVFLKLNAIVENYTNHK